MNKLNQIGTCFKDTHYELYFDAIEKIQDTPDYKIYREKINKTKLELMNKYSITSEGLIDKLISLVEESMEYEYEFANEQIINYIDKNI